MSEIHVAVAVIINQLDEVLISLRPDHVHQGGFWEFPGGKVESGETVYDALKREISEELEITVVDARPYKVIRHHYSDKTVVLNVWLVSEFKGEPWGVEGQIVEWRSIKQLRAVDFPAANRSIVHSLFLPDRYMITGNFEGHNEFLQRLERSLKKGINLIQLRCKNCSGDEYLLLAKEAKAMCDSYHAILLLNTEPAVFDKVGAQGLHLSGRRLHETKTRPIDETKYLSVSCHSISDIEKAKEIKADIVLLSPVKETNSHPGVKGIGWEKFSELISSNDIPAYALGGMNVTDVEKSKAAGAQGIAAISSLWAGS